MNVNLTVIIMKQPGVGACCISDQNDAATEKAKNVLHLKDFFFFLNGQLLRWCTFIGLSIFKSQPFPVSAGTLVGRRVGHIQPSEWSSNRTMMGGNIASALPKPHLY